MTDFSTGNTMYHSLRIYPVVKYLINSRISYCHVPVLINDNHSYKVSVFLFFLILLYNTSAFLYISYMQGAEGLYKYPVDGGISALSYQRDHLHTE